MIDIIKACPFKTEPEPKRGKWIYKQTNGEAFIVCSECGHIEWNIPHKFCPNCQAKMEEEKMTDTELKRREAICEIAGVDDIGELSDGFHTFNALYEQRMILFAALVKVYKDKAWKSYRHEDGEYCFGGGWFIVGIDTPEGAYTYHYENKYWDMFDCADLPRGKHWDGHTEKDVTRLLTLPYAQPERHPGKTLAEEVERIKSEITNIFAEQMGIQLEITVDPDAIRELPSARQEIIRCKDCKHYQFADNRAFGMPVKMCKWFSFEDVDDYDFCSRAERRTDDLQ